MKWEEIDLDACYEYLKTAEDTEYNNLAKDIMNIYAKGSNLTTKQKNVLKRFYVLDVLDVDIFSDESVCNMTYTEILDRLKQ
jgi:plasmid replication initiation protein